MTFIKITFLALALLVLVFQNCSGRGASTSTNESSSSVLGSSIDAQCIIPISKLQKLSQTCFGALTPPLISGAISYTNYFEYEPQYSLYSDGATKRRWIFLPAGQKINTDNIDNWLFPKGTIIFKEFTMGTKKIETRVLEKLTSQNGPKAWRFSNYAWTTDQTDAELVTSDFYSAPASDLARFNAASVITQYKVASPTTCISCHDGAVDTVNGFNYLQLSSSSTQFNIAKATQAGFFTNPPSGPDQIPGSDLDRKVVGYIQSNCATCHSENGPGTGNFRHSSHIQTLDAEPLMLTAVARRLITKGNADTSLLYTKFSSGLMPEVHPERPDISGLSDMRSWIQELQ